MVHICKKIEEKEFEDLRQTCWSCLVILEDSEQNKNVLEALKVGQVRGGLHFSPIICLTFKYSIQIEDK